MTLEETYNFFERIKTDATNKSQIKIFEKFLHIPSKLKTIEFSNEEIAIMETELDNFNLLISPKNKIEHFNKALHKFKSFLKDTFSLITKGYYMNLGLALGVSFGILFGIVLPPRWEHSLGIALGIGLGMTIGKSFDAKAKRESRVL